MLGKIFSTSRSAISTCPIISHLPGSLALPKNCHRKSHSSIRIRYCLAWRQCGWRPQSPCRTVQVHQQRIRSGFRKIWYPTKCWCLLFRYHACILWMGFTFRVSWTTIWSIRRRRILGWARRYSRVWATKNIFRSALIPRTVLSCA